MNRITMVLVAMFSVGCGLSGELPDYTGADLAGDLGPELDDRQLPPMGDEKIMLWLSRKFYDQSSGNGWKCETERHPKRPGSGHFDNRICSNALLSAFDPTSRSPYPVGAAAVKEIFIDRPGSNEPNGYAVYRKTAEGGCDTYYYYERLRGKIVADKVADGTCIGCHNAAGKGSNTGHDCVYTQIQ